MSNWSNDEKKSLNNAGYKQSSIDPDKMINGNHWVKRVGDSTIFKTTRHGNYGSGMSTTDFDNRLNK